MSELHDVSERLLSLRVADVMARSVVAVNAAQTMTEAAQFLCDHDVSAALVVDEQRRVLGILSASDFLQADRDRLTREDNADDRVESYMTRDLQSLPPGASMMRAAREMDAHHLHRLPVIDDQGQAVGIVSTMDIVASVVNAIDEIKSSLQHGDSQDPAM